MALGATAAMLCVGCSDTWDEHYFSSEGTTATKTIWEQIQANPDLSRFAKIAEKAVYYKDENHPLTNMKTGKPYTFSDKFSEAMPMTVWAPNNDAISEEEMNKWLELVDKQPYAVHQQLMANSTALNRNVATNGGIDSLLMLNGKRMVFDKSKFTMQNLPLVQAAMNIAATNGTLHTMSAIIPFEYNMYEYVKDAVNAQKNKVNTFHQYILKTDTIYFNQGGSIEGNPDENGNPTYVDSAYINTNKMFHNKKLLTNVGQDRNLTYMESFGANIAGEDSDFVLVIPTDAAWETAYKKMKPLYKYANIYVDNEKGNSSTVAYREISEDIMDSLTNQSINMDIISPICFNARKQPKLSSSAPLWTSEGLLKASDSDIEYLINTYGDTLRTDDEWTKTSLWAGKNTVKMSNGIGVITDVWDMPRKLYKPNLNIEIGWQSFYNTAASASSTQTRNWPFSHAVASAWVDSVGYVSHDNFYELEPASENNSINSIFRLVGTDGENSESEVMSGTYDICIVCVPDFYKTSTDTIEGDTIRHRITATLNYCNNASNGKDVQLKIANKDAIEYAGEKVDTIVLFKDFTFPYSYKNLRYSYPTLQLGTYSTSADRDPKKTHPIFRNNLCIDRILLISKEDNSVEEIPVE